MRSASLLFAAALMLQFPGDIRRTSKRLPRSRLNPVARWTGGSRSNLTSVDDVAGLRPGANVLIDWTFRRAELNLSVQKSLWFSHEDDA